MLPVDDFIKLILAISVSFAIAIVAWQLARVLGAVASNLQDIRKIVQNLGDLSDMALEDYERIRDFIGNIKNSFASFQGFLNIFENLRNLKDRLPKFGKSAENEVDEAEESLS